MADEETLRIDPEDLDSEHIDEELERQNQNTSPTNLGTAGMAGSGQTSASPRSSQRQKKIHYGGYFVFFVLGIVATGTGFWLGKSQIAERLIGPSEGKSSEEVENPKKRKESEHKPGAVSEEITQQKNSGEKDGSRKMDGGKDQNKKRHSGPSDKPLGSVRVENALAYAERMQQKGEFWKARGIYEWIQSLPLSHQRRRQVGERIDTCREKIERQRWMYSVTHPDSPLPFWWDTQRELAIFPSNDALQLRQSESPK